MSSAVDRAYTHVREHILDGSLPAGDLLSEAVIGGQLGISRTPVHAAFLRLAGEGFLTLVPRRGAVVVPVSPQEAADVLDVRLALEAGAVRRLADLPAADRAALAETLAEIVGEQHDLAAAGDLEAFAHADEAFHRAVVNAAGNAVAEDLYASIADRQRRMTIGSVRGRPDHLATLTAEHEALAALVAAGDRNGFEAALHAHLWTTHDVLTGRTDR